MYVSPFDFCVRERHTKNAMNRSFMKAFSVALISVVVGFVYTYVQPQLNNVVPASWKSNKLTQAFFSGAFIIVAVVISIYAVRLFKLPVPKGA